MIQADPISQLHDALGIEIIECKAVKNALGAALNVNMFNKTRGNESPDVVSERDVPNLRFEQTGGPMNIQFASSLVEMKHGYNVVLNTGDQRVSRQLDPLLFALFSFFVASCTKSKLTALQWRGKSYVKSMELTSSRVGMSDPQYNAGIKGWISVCTVVFHLNFHREDVINFSKGVL